MTASEKVAYLKGLAEGLGINGENPEGKLMLAIIEAMGSLASDVEDLEANLADMADSMDELSDDIAYVEDLALGGDEEVEGEGDEECDGDCSCCSGCEDEEGDFEVVCPTCGKVSVITDEDIDFGGIICSGCGEELEFEFDEDDEDDDDDDDD